MLRFLCRRVVASRPDLILAELIEKSHSGTRGASYAAADGSAETSGLFLLAVLGILGAAGFLASDGKGGLPRRRSWCISSRPLGQVAMRTPTLMGNRRRGRTC
jgi:hypothetical protein